MVRWAYDKTETSTYKVKLSLEKKVLEQRNKKSLGKNENIKRNCRKT